MGLRVEVAQSLNSGTYDQARLATLATYVLLFDEVTTETRSVTADTTLGDDDVTLFVDTSGGNVNVTLRDAALTPGRMYVVKKTATANDVTFVRTGTNNIEGVGGNYAWGAGGALAQRWVQSDGTDWWMVTLS